MDERSATSPSSPGSQPARAATPVTPVTPVTPTTEPRTATEGDAAAPATAATETGRPADTGRPRGAQEGDAHELWGMRATGVLAGLGIVFLAVAIVVLVGSRGWGYDFDAYYGASLRLRAGESLYLPFTVEGPFRPGPAGLYLYAPPLGLATTLFTFLPRDAAVFPWAALHVVALIAGCALMPVSRRVRLATFGIAAFSGPVLADFVLGNVSTFVFLLSVLVWRWVDRPLGSVALVLAASIRAPLGIVAVWWLLRRRLRPVVWTALAGAALVAVTLPFVGIDAYLDYLRVLRNVSGVTGVLNNHDLSTTALELRLPQPLAELALVAGYGTALIAMLASLRRDRELSLVVTLGATLLLSPLLWDHYLVSLLIPAAFLASRGRSWALLLPVLAWLPWVGVLPLLAVAGVLLPFLAPAPAGAHPDAQEPTTAGSGRTLQAAAAS